MRRTTQTDTSRGNGNCLQAAVASLLDLPLSQVPHFVRWPDWEIRFMNFMKEHGTPVTLGPYSGTSTGIGIGPTIRDTTHAVVLKDGQMYWDPHPSRDGLLRVTHVYATNMR